MTSLESDLQAIRALNDQDARAVLTNDIATITSQWSDDFVVIHAGGPIIRGRAANVAVVEKVRDQMQSIETLEYVTSFEEIQIAGDYAYEWGTYRGSMRPRDGGAIMSSSGKLMRILQRQPDGSWKMHRTMLTTDPTSGRSVTHSSPHLSLAQRRDVPQVVL